MSQLTTKEYDLGYNDAIRDRSRDLSDFTYEQTRAYHRGHALGVAELEDLEVPQYYQNPHRTAGR